MSRHRQAMLPTIKFLSIEFGLTLDSHKMSKVAERWHDGFAIIRSSLLLHTSAQYFFFIELTTRKPQMLLINDL